MKLGNLVFIILLILGYIIWSMHHVSLWIKYGLDYSTKRDRGIIWFFLTLILVLYSFFHILNYLNNFKL